MNIRADQRLEDRIGWRPQPDTEEWRGTETILFVEDEKFVREVTAEVLCGAGYGLLIAENAADALRVYERHSGGLDLLLADVILPGETGPELYAKLLSRDRKLKALFVTGYVEHMKTMRGQECLPKPFSTLALLQTVREVLDRRELASAV